MSQKGQTQSIRVESFERKKKSEKNYLLKKKTWKVIKICNPQTSLMSNHLLLLIRWKTCIGQSQKRCIVQMKKIRTRIEVSHLLVLRSLIIEMRDESISIILTILILNLRVSLKGRSTQSLRMIKIQPENKGTNLYLKSMCLGGLRKSECQSSHYRIIN